MVRAVERSRASIRILLLIILLASEICAQAIKVLKPEPASIAGAVKGHCVTVSKSVRVCKIVSESDDALIVEKDGQWIGSWQVSAFMGETEDFEVIRADLDGDRQPELIVANHDGTSQGLGVNYWTISIFPSAEFAGFQVPLTFSVEEYGSLGTFVPARGHVNIFATTWESTTDPKGKRGEGLYLLGQWWQYKSGALSPIPHKPTIGRRYLGSFEKERWATIDSPKAPYRWLTHGSTERLSLETIFGAPKSETPGTIQTVSPVTDNRSYRTVKIEFNPDNQAGISGIYPLDETDEENGFRYLGDAATGRIYPTRYLPSQPESWLNGKRAILRTYARRSSEINVLWLER